MSGQPCIEYADAIQRGKAVLDGFTATDDMPDGSCPGCGLGFGGTFDTEGFIMSNPYPSDVDGEVGAVEVMQTCNAPGFAFE